MGLALEVRRLYAAREVLRNLISSDLKLRFRRSILGYAWSLLYPVLTMLLIALVFYKMVRFNSFEDHILYVFAGLVPWNFFVASCISCGSSILNNEALLKKVYLPKMVFPTASLLARFVDFLFNLAALFLIVSFISFKPTLALLTLPAALLLFLLFVSGVTVALSAITVYIRDAVHLTGVLLQLAFYATPIIYPEEFIKDYAFWFEFNPMIHFTRLFQGILWKGVIPPPEQWAMAGGVAVFFCVAGYGLFLRLERDLVFRL